MNSFLKSGFLLGIGAAVAGKEKFEETVMKLVEKGTMTSAEADTIFDDLFKKGEAKNEEWNDEIKMMAKKQLSDLGFVTRDEFNLLKAQLLLLQEEIANLRNSTQTSVLDKTDEGIDHIPPGFSKDVK